MTTSTQTHTLSWNPDISIWLSIDPLSDKYPSLSPYNYCANNPIMYVDPDGREIFYSQDGTRLGQVGNNTDLRVVNTTMTNAQALTHIQAGTESLQTLMGSSVAFSDYFTTVADVTNDAVLQTYTNHESCCFTASTAQLTLAGVAQTGPDNAINTLVDNTAERNTKRNNNRNLTADPFGGAIRIQTELNSGNPVMVGVEQTRSDGTIPNPNNINALTGHFVVIRSSNVAANGTVTFNYLENASTALGKNANNNITLNSTTGVITDSSVPARSSIQQYRVSEVRKNR